MASGHLPLGQATTLVSRDAYRVHISLYECRRTSSSGSIALPPTLMHTSNQGPVRGLERPEVKVKQVLQGLGEGEAETHLLSVAGESLVVAEERPGLSDHRQQGRQLLKSQRERQGMATGCRETQTGWEARTEREKERESSVSVTATRHKVHSSSGSSQKTAFSLGYVGMQATLIPNSHS